jgi:ATP-dependent Clp protease ATP-binding subunit ClpB
LQDREMDIELAGAALDLIAEGGFDPVYGARPLKRALQQMIENPLAQDILSGKFVPGDCILVDVEDSHIVFKKGKSKATAA